MEPYPEFFIEAASIRGVYDSTAEDAEAVAGLLRAHGARRILDVPCGFGRIAAPLQAMGFEVTAVDASPAQIAVAERRNPGPAYLVGNMLEPPPGPFDAILNIYTSFGYMPSAERDFDCLLAWHRRLRQGGVLIIETLDTERVASIDEEERDLQRPDGVFVRQTGALTEYIHTDGTSNIMSIEYHLHGNVFTSRTRLYHRDALRRLLLAAGFASVGMYADFRGSPAYPASPTVFVAVRQVAP